MRSQPTSRPLPEALQLLKPLTTREIERYLLAPTESEWTAYVDNLRLGTDASAIAYLSRRMGCMGLYFVAKPLQRKSKPSGDLYTGAMVFSLYGPRSASFNGNQIRDVRVFGDVGGWVFQQTGTPLPFENTDAYDANRVEGRFTLDMLKQYLQKMSIRAFDKAFYLPRNREPGHLVEVSRNGR